MRITTISFCEDACNGRSDSRRMVRFERYIWRWRVESDSTRFEIIGEMFRLILDATPQRFCPSETIPLASCQTSALMHRAYSSLCPPRLLCPSPPVCHLVCPSIARRAYRLEVAADLTDCTEGSPPHAISQTHHLDGFGCFVKTCLTVDRRNLLPHQSKP